MVKFSAFLSFLLLLSNQLHAQSIDELLSSDQFKKFEKTTRRSTNPRKNKTDQGEYLNLFKNGITGIAPLLSWVGTGSGEFKRGRGNFKTHKGFIEASAPFKILNADNNHANWIMLTIYVPKPSSISVSSIGLFREFRSLEPPDLEITLEEKVEVASIDGRVFHHKSGACSLLLKLTRGALLNLYTRTCANHQSLIDLATSLDIRRLGQKLNS